MIKYNYKKFLVNLSLFILSLFFTFNLLKATKRRKYLCPGFFCKRRAVDEDSQKQLYPGYLFQQYYFCKRRRAVDEESQEYPEFNHVVLINVNSSRGSSSSNSDKSNVKEPKTGFAPADVIPDGKSSLTTSDGSTVRVGSIGAAIQNVKELSKQETLEGPYWDSLLKISKEALEKVGFYQHLSWTNRSINTKLAKERLARLGQKRLLPQDVEFNPSNLSSAQYQELWQGIIDLVGAQKMIYPKEQKYVKMHKLLQQITEVVGQTYVKQNLSVKASVEQTYVQQNLSMRASVEQQTF